MSRGGVQLVVAAVLVCGAVHAEDLSTRPITMVIPYAAGGPTDAVGRLFAQALTETMRRPIVVENVAGAGGTTGASRVAKSAPDGSQFLFVGSAMTYVQLLYKKPPFNSLSDFTPVALLTQQPLVLVARKDLQANNLQDFVHHLKAIKIASFGSSGAGSSSHLACVRLNIAMGVNATHVPYRGIGVAMQDLIAGRIDYWCDLIPNAVPQVQGGNVKAIAMLSPSRSPVLPDVPTADEQGLPSFEAADWYGLFLPKGAAPPTMQSLHAAANAVLDAPSFRDRLLSLGVEIVAPERRSPDYLASFLKDEIVKWAATIKAAGVTAD
jgi:tripartite-type tricarboxylate transporter receptor subunit TctC